ncbi:uncharacterized protein Z518_04667 [Rhinocladiella mackenziei CBS 650.93]|uniref:Uncharacterized protein n=1 Tax=Rhinocladiella mackenziei CBS 650.93 TaxID=1442369 RepID=A0A0D2IU50_9EURO|nr:uncharacterized protein Z518_04667 [Rhinocladiella mackenziei CBS 650.93]KIX06691.1 hypothetical protein Z518_04667 [Rhinocladiella mackenziei CBS 650.93]
MSTSTPPNGRVASQDPEEHSEDYHLSLPAFHSLRDNSRDGVTRTGSVASGSRSHRSRSRNAEQEPGHVLDRLSHGSSIRSDPDSRNRDKEKENGGRRHNVARSSGGFLLEPVSNSKHLSHTSLAPHRKDSKGKRNSEESGLSISKRRQRNGGHANASFKSSPLASEVKQDPVVHDHPNSDQLVPGTDVRRSTSSSQNDGRFDGSSSMGSRKIEVKRSPMADVGYDHDPAQIVNMALSLSEGRRRLASVRRYVSTEQGERRVVSAASTTSPRNTVKRKSIAPFLAPKRQSSRNGSPKPTFTPLYHDPNQPTSIPPTDAVTAEPDELDDDMDFTDQISPATAARVEKAKLYFELAHEHRRLLSHLPPIRRPGILPRSSSPEEMQKAYNPLQYVRNRKLRIWEKTPINSEADGWHDVQKVRSWVDAVVSSHSEIRHDSTECVRLPPLDQRRVNSHGDDPDTSPDEPKNAMSPRIPDQIHSKPSRPRSDWVTHPADMIADAYWLEQGMNKTKIQDRDNNLIYPPNTHFKFAGWRHEKPVDVPSILQQPSPSPSPEPDQYSPEEAPPSALPELPTFKSAHHSHKHRRHGRRRDKIKDSLQPKEISSPGERTRIRRKLFQDSSESDYSESTSSDEGAPERGRKRLRRRRHASPGTDDREKHYTHPQTQLSPHKPGLGRGNSSPGSSGPNSKRSSVDHTALNKLFRVDSFKKSSPLARSRVRHESSRPTSVKVPIRSSHEQERAPRASTEYDTTTAPNSPNGVEWPSIAINLSPPPSRNTSPTRKPISTILHPFYRKPHKEQGQISTTDFAQVPPSHPVHQDRGSDVDKNYDSPGTRDTSPMTRDLSPLSKDRTHSTQPDDLALHSSNEPRFSTASKVSTRSTTHAASDHSKIRGIFKGGRIAEIVGNEVSRVGDFIWKRDPPSVDKLKGSASDGSLRSHHGSDSEKEIYHLNGTILKTPPQTYPRSRSSTVSSTKSERISPNISNSSPPSSDRPRYNNPNLPSFTSPFQRDREQQEKKQKLLEPDSALGRTDSTDHISRLAAQHRSASHSPRLDRIGLPKLDTGVPRTPDGLTHRKSYGFGSALDLSRSRDASELLNNAIGPVTGVTPLRPSRSTGDLSQAEGFGDGQELMEPPEVSWRDIGRAEALLYTSTVKAREIGRREDDPGTELPKFLLDTLTPENEALHSATPLRVKKRDHHIVAAQNIMKILERSSSTFNSKSHSFSASVAPSLHIQLQTLEDMVENTMTPQVRMTADDAGELSMKLTTTSTLAVKELNDSIGVAFRRRRRGPIRLLRKIWFAGIEWTVVGLLWFIWAIVSVIRFVLCLINGVVTTVRWLLWID